MKEKMLRQMCGVKAGQGGSKGEKQNKKKNVWKGKGGKTAVPQLGRGSGPAQILGG